MARIRKARVTNRRVKIDTKRDGGSIYLDGKLIGRVASPIGGGYRETYVEFYKTAGDRLGGYEAVCRTYSHADASRWAKGVLLRFTPAEVAERCGFNRHHESRVTPGEVFRLATGLGIGE